MAGGANKAFLADPHSFLNQNLVVVKEGKLARPAGHYKVNLHLTADTATDENGAALSVYAPYLSVAGDKGGVGSNQFEAWFLPWQPDKTFQLTLDNSAQFLFTPGMSGCTFVSASGNTPTVAHLNYLTPGTEKVSDVITAQKVGDVFGGQRVARTRREDYKADGSALRRVFVVGWRGHNKWAFYAQHLDIIGAAAGTIWKRLRAPESLKYVHEIP
jgi:hypothetical protein